MQQNIQRSLKAIPWNGDGMEIFAEPLLYIFFRRPPKDELGGLIVNFKLHSVNFSNEICLFCNQGT